MIHLSIQIAGKPIRRLDTDKPSILIGRAPACDIQVQADNVSSQHGIVALIEGEWVFQDLKSTNGSMILRDGKRYVINREPREMLLAPGDRICLASNDNTIVVESIDPVVEMSTEVFDRTILAEQESKGPADIEHTLGEDFGALRSTVELARELTGCDTVRSIADLTCKLALKAFPKVKRVFFLTPHLDHFALETALNRDENEDFSSSTLTASHKLIDRCLKERKGYLFLFDSDKMQAFATRFVAAEALESGQTSQEKVVLCCPLFHQERCHGFIELEAPLETGARSSLTRRDLSLATLMGHLIAARLNDLEQQVERLKLARKATAGYLSATVGHCFKNLLFVPMSMSKMLPLCVKQGKMEEVEWMLARNGVNIRYLDILSNEFAAASKDPTEGFEPCDLPELLNEVAELINQIGPDKIQAVVSAPKDFGEVVCHPAALKRLLMNLTLNAVDAIFMSKREDKGTIGLKLAHQAGSPTYTLTVTDNGPGIPDDIMLNLRDIFRRVQASADALDELQNIAEQVRSTKEQGFKEHYGLGFLFVCQTVNQHHGDLKIEARAGAGTTFTIELPFRGPNTLPEKTSSLSGIEDSQVRLI